jgi:hypothetical protein
MRILTYFIPLLAVLAVAIGCQRENSTGMQLCHQQYALCTSAICIPQPGDPSQAICTCDVEEGPSMSTVACEKLQPSTDSHGIRTVFSTFSQEQLKQGKKGMKCPSGTPWTWCLNKRCTVDPSNPSKAICICDVVRTGEWMTLGGNCDTSTCETGYWSGASMKDAEESSDFMKRILGFEQTPFKWCPSVSS